MTAASRRWLNAGPDATDPSAAAATTDLASARIKPTAENAKCGVHLAKPRQLAGYRISADRAAPGPKPQRAGYRISALDQDPTPPTSSPAPPAGPEMRPSASPLWSPRAALFEVLSADSTGGLGTMRTAEPSFDIDAARFIGATIRLFDAEVLVIRVVARVLGDRAEAPALVAAFGARFRRTIVLVAQDRRGVPTYFGPGPIATVLARMPFDALPWRRYRYRPPRPQMLPIPVDPLPSYTTDYGSDDSVAERASHDHAAKAPADRTVAGHRKPDAQEVARRTRTLPPR